jgi:hypothetical protein
VCRTALHARGAAAAPHRAPRERADPASSPSLRRQARRRQRAMTPRDASPRRAGRARLARGSLSRRGRAVAMNLRYALLALLGEGEAHGYELLKRFNERIGPFWHPNIGQLYRLPRKGSILLRSRPRLLTLR